jgi:hypothetical protein
MAKALVAAWAACVKDLQVQLQQQVAAISASPTAPTGIITHVSSDFSSLLGRFTKLKEQPPLPHAAWKKLVQDVQVMCWGTQPWADLLGHTWTCTLASVPNKQP